MERDRGVFQMLGKLTSSKTVYVLLGIGVLSLGSAQPAHAFNTDVIDWAIGELCGHIQGHLGSLLTTAAAFGAIVAAAMGSYRVFYGAIMTAVGAFAVSTIMSLYFPEAANICKSGSQNGGAPRKAAVASTDTGNAQTTDGGGDSLDSFFDKP
jgi:hypothetical protein